MARGTNIEGTATVRMNGEQAEAELKRLQGEARQFQRQLTTAVQKGDKEAEKLARQGLRTVNGEMKAIKEQTQSVSAVMNDLSRTSLKNLQAAHRKLSAEVRNLNRDTEEYAAKTKQLKLIDQEIRNQRASLRDTSSWWQRANDAVNNYLASVGLVIAGIVGIVQSFRKISDVITEWEKSLTNVKTLLSGEDLEKYTGTLEETSIEMIKLGFDIEDVNKALFDSVSAGISAADAQEFLAQTAKLATGGVTELGTAVDGTTTVLNAFKLDIQDTEAVTSAFFTAQKFGKTTVGELASEIGKVAPLAQMAGLSFQEILSATSAITLNGIKTNETITYLKAALTSLTKATPAAEKVLRQFGVPVGITEVQAAGLGNTLQALNNAIAQHPNEILKAIPSMEGFMAIASLTGEGLEKYDEILQAVNTDIGENSSLNAANAMQQETTAQAIARAQGELKATMLTLRNELNPVILATMKAYSSLNKLLLNTIMFFSKHIDVIKILVKAIGIAVTATVSYHTAVKIATLWTARKTVAVKAAKIAEEAAFAATQLLASAQMLLTRNVKGSVQAFKVFSATLKANPFGLIVSLLATAGAAYLSFRNKVKDAADEQSRFNQLQKEAQEILDNAKSLEETFNILNTLDKRQTQAFRDKAQAEIETIEDRLSSVTSDLKSAYQTRLQQIREEEAVSEDATATQIQLAELGFQRKKALLDAEFQNKIDAELGMSETEIRETKKRLQNYVNAANARLSVFTDVSDDITATAAGTETDIQAAIAAAQLQLLHDKVNALDSDKAYYQEKLDLLNDYILAEKEIIADEADYLAAKFAETYQGQIAHLEAQLNAGLISRAEANDRVKALAEQHYNDMRQNAAAYYEQETAAIRAYAEEITGIFTNFLSQRWQTKTQQIATEKDLVAELNAARDAVAQGQENAYARMQQAQEALLQFEQDAAYQRKMNNRKVLADLLAQALDYLKVKAQIAVAGATIEAIASGGTLSAASIAKIVAIEAAFAVAKAGVNAWGAGSIGSAGTYKGSAYTNNAQQNLYQQAVPAYTPYHVDYQTLISANQQTGSSATTTANADKNAELTNAIKNLNGKLDNLKAKIVYSEWDEAVNMVNNIKSRSEIV